MDYPESMMRQAPHTIEFYLGEAIESIDKCFGEGYAKKHPELVGSFIQACTVDFDAAIIGSHIEHISNALSDINSTIEQMN